MKKKIIVRTLLCCVISLVLLFIDLITKAWAEAACPNQGGFFLGIVRLYFTKNPGAAFGLSADNRAGMIAITAFTVVLIIGIAVLFFTVFRRNFAVQFVLGIVEAGAVGNLVDRLYFGWVRDFMEFVSVKIGNFTLIPGYTCNFADMCIVLGAIVLVFMILFIGPGAVFPLTKKWKEQSKQLEEEREKSREEKQKKRVDRMLENAGYIGPEEPLVEELSSGAKPEVKTEESQEERPAPADKPGGKETEKE